MKMPGTTAIGRLRTLLAEQLINDYPFWLSLMQGVQTYKPVYDWTNC